MRAGRRAQPALPGTGKPQERQPRCRVRDVVRVLVLQDGDGAVTPLVQRSGMRPQQTQPVPAWVSPQCPPPWAVGCPCRSTVGDVETEGKPYVKSTFDEESLIFQDTKPLKRRGNGSFSPGPDSTALTQDRSFETLHKTVTASAKVQSRAPLMER